MTQEHLVEECSSRDGEERIQVAPTKKKLAQDKTRWKDFCQ